MNRNTRGYYNEARRNNAKGINQSSFDIPKLLSMRGESATWGTYGKKTFNFSVQPRKSKRAKVAAKGQRTRGEIEQEEQEILEQEAVKEMEIAKKMPAPTVS